MSDGKVVLITGAARGIGLEAARLTAERNWTVIGLDVLDAQTLDPFSRFIRCDLTDDAQIESCVESIMNEYGRLDGLVNNAALTPVSQFLEASLDDLDAAYQVNVRGLFRMAQHGARAMVQNGGGSIVNLSSINAERGVRGTSVYSLTKGAVAALTRTIAVELADQGVRCNAVAPAPTATEKILALLSPEQITVRESRIPAGRLGQPREIAAGIVWLLSEESSFVNGLVMQVDGGYLAYGS